uniref:Uncharacterized protein n=1 Tax=Arundo donax TaxID=35708 RepID=A0A0A9HES2_ARUDO
MSSFPACLSVLPRFSYLIGMRVIKRKKLMVGWINLANLIHYIYEKITNMHLEDLNFYMHCCEQCCSYMGGSLWSDESMAFRQGCNHGGRWHKKGLGPGDHNGDGTSKAGNSRLTSILLERTEEHGIHPCHPDKDSICSNRAGG